ncbi:MAG: GMC family oxidoreductase, partial [Rubrimonas sp.]
FPVNQRRGVRWNARKAFLQPARKRPNLSIVTGAHVETLVLDGLRVTGVTWRQDGRRVTALAGAEVVLAAGAIGTPQILQLSGLGPAEKLIAAGVPPALDMPGVGANLQDHLQLRTIFRIEGARTLNDRARTLLGKVGIGLEYLLFQSGPMAMAPSQLGIFARSGPEHETANIEYHVQPLSLDAFGQPLHPFPALTVSVCNLRPESRGSVMITCPDPRAAPSIRPNYLSTDGDRRVAAASIRHARRLMQTRAMRPYRPFEMKPGPQIQHEDGLVRAAGDIGTTIFHPVGTARMGSDPAAPVRPDLLVRGVGGLSVADASVMPTIVSGNTHAPVTMIAERAADLILARAKG